MPLVLILAAACSGGSSGPSEKSAPSSSAFSVTDALQPDGPLRGVAFTGHVDRDDPQVRPTLAFTTEDTEVTAVIGLGDVGEGSTVVVTWYRVAGLEERELLFSHEIAIGPGGLAFSQAIAPNGLAPGIYDTVATMDEHVVHTPWVVREAGASGTGATAQSASGDQTPDAPGSGNSWWDEFGGEPPPQQGTPNDTCRIHSFFGGTVPIRDVKADTSWLGLCTTVTLTATVSGPPATIASSDSAPVDSLRGQTDVCSLSGGTDLPGTVVHFEATGSASASEDFTLPDLGDVLTAGLEGLPEAGSRVEPGDRIVIHAIAFVMPPALGVKTLYVDDGSDLLESVGNLSGSDQPVACDIRRLIAELFTEYSVPADAPPVIELCATGVGFDGTESKNCIRYYTGEVWEGEWDEGSGFRYTLGCPQFVPIRGTISFAVADDGSLSGRFDWASDPYTCHGPVPSVRSELEVIGKRTADGFRLGIFGEAYPLRLTRQGNEASGRIVIGGPTTTTHALTVRCVSCR